MLTNGSGIGILAQAPAFSKTDERIDVGCSEEPSPRKEMTDKDIALRDLPRESSYRLKEVMQDEVHVPEGFSPHHLC